MRKCIKTAKFCLNQQSNNSRVQMLSRSTLSPSRIECPQSNNTNWNPHHRKEPPNSSRPSISKPTTNNPSHRSWLCVTMRVIKLGIAIHSRTSLKWSKAWSLTVFISQDRMSLSWVNQPEAACVQSSSSLKEWGEKHTQSWMKRSCHNQIGLFHLTELSWRVQTGTGK